VGADVKVIFVVGIVEVTVGGFTDGEEVNPVLLEDTVDAGEVRCSQPYWEIENKNSIMTPVINVFLIMSLFYSLL